LPKPGESTRTMKDMLCCEVELAIAAIIYPKMEAFTLHFYLVWIFFSLWCHCCVKGRANIVLEVVRWIISFEFIGWYSRLFYKRRAFGARETTYI
jgi:hypothetical protein